MADDSVQGLDATLAVFDKLPEASRDQIAVELGILGQEILAAQRAATPVDTGTLAASLSLALQLDQLRLRSGLFGIAGKRSRKGGTNYGGLFYGVIVNYGRSAGVAVVERRRRVNGKLRSLRGRKRVEDIETTYALPIKAMAARPFIELPEQNLDQLVAGQLQEFWQRTLARASA